MNRNIGKYLPFPLLMWRTITQPFWDGLAWMIDLLLKIKLRQMDIHK